MTTYKFQMKIQFSSGAQSVEYVRAPTAAKALERLAKILTNRPGSAMPTNVSIESEGWVSISKEENE